MARWGQSRATLFGHLGAHVLAAGKVREVCQQMRYPLFPYQDIDSGARILHAYHVTSRDEMTKSGMIMWNRRDSGHHRILSCASPH